MKVAFVYPGQGSQDIGMGKELYENFPEAREVFETVDEVLKYKLSDLMFTGDILKLTQTEHAQPALMTVSMAIMKVLEKRASITVDYTTCLFGHSLGEYTAITAAGGFTVLEAAKLLRIRGKAMQEAAPEGISGMVAIIGIDANQAQEFIDKSRLEGEICQIANDNSEGQVVASGHNSSLDRLIKIVMNHGYKAVKLPVSAAFHSDLMLPAKMIMSEALSIVKVKKPIVPIICNFNAKLCEDPEVITDLLVKQVSGRVRFRESVIRAYNMGIDKFYEIGHGKVLTGLIKRISPKAEVKPVGNVAGIQTIMQDFEKWDK